MKCSSSVFNKEMNYNILVFCIAIYFGIVLNIPLWQTFYEILSKLEIVSVGFIISLPIFLIAALNIIFQLLAWPYIGRVLFSVLTFVSAITAYASYHYGIIFDYGMMENIFETNSGEAASYFSLSGLIAIILIGVVPCLFIIGVKIKKQSFIKTFVIYKLISIVVSILIIILIAALFYKDYASVGRNNKYLNRVINPSYVYTGIKYIDRTYFTKPIPYQKIGTDAKLVTTATSNGKPTLFVFVLGETARSQNYQANGYARPTNQYTQSDNMISFKNVTSCGTATAVSVPCMFSAMNRSNYKKAIAYNQDTFIDILHRAGISILWKENDGGDKGAGDRIQKITLNHSATDPLCDGESCLDMALLNNFHQEVANMKGNKFITLHIMGSHGPTYYKRYPKDRAFFKPDCQRSDIENCTKEQIVNSYDNTILYTDYMISQLIQQLKGYSDKYNTALFYISDHGESLGEGGLYLHGTPYSLAPKYQTTVPMMMWFSKSFTQDRGLNLTCLENIANNAKRGDYSQDNVFSSMLGIMNVNTSVYKPKQDLFRQCRTH
ncbi:MULTISPECIES: phosphoethanolamine transferase [Photobacterium]|uniref:phosphoethanolamine transferase n=1 Tax=Photobacterium TaxID=657 RepID=UPI001E4FDE6A|nr:MULTISPECIES: phosphoethanolamine--lipid A transferase [Photobacterium]MCD9465691.1 phosphoethanolamine transferase [Photobacterium iliopiscarium]MCD9485634.1 phosphoethanolamine--lipid A transferase [Photobacterium iliopiscarium]MCD9543305.1 phosphoethanolamine--lipid A transferase [Photobacterium carnosum]MCF2242331.1 phosphoethanolamine--lipid A transferase [Photobacterium iliopiscarium]